MVAKPPLTYVRNKNVVWLQPTFIAEINYREWTHDGKLRHVSYKGLRDEADEATVYEVE
ncbi:ATP dependent DNA ligase [Rhizobium leguminosarum]